mgnify:FL=1
MVLTKKVIGELIINFTNYSDVSEILATAEGEKEMEELLKNNKELREMKEELERITADPELREKYYYREKQLRDELSRIKDGYMKGIKEKEKEIVLNMHKNNMDIKTICNIVQITEEEVRKILEEWNRENSKKV